MKRNLLFALISGFLALSIACQFLPKSRQIEPTSQVDSAALEQTTSPTPTQKPTPTQQPTSTTIPTSTQAVPTLEITSQNIKVGLVTDIGGIWDRSFNQSAWEGVQKAATEFGIEGTYLVSSEPDDYEENIDRLVEEGCNVIVTVGFLMGDATAVKARQYPEIKFGILDNAYFPFEGSVACGADVKDCYDDGGLQNVTSLMFQEDQVGFLAGVLAGGMTKTDVVCSVSGAEIPPVVRFVTGYQNGAKWMNPEVTTLNEYIPSFIDPDEGYETGMDMIEQNCDIVFGVGGSTGNGGLRAANEQNVMAIGVDVDQYLTFPEVGESLLSSAKKNADAAVYEFIKSIVDNTDKPGIVTANLSNGGVGLAPFHAWETSIPAEVKDKIQEAIDGLIEGSISTGY